MNEGERRHIIDGWLASPRTGPSPPEFRHYVVREYAERYQRPVLIESGTCYGNTVAATMDLFDEVWTVELAPALHQRAVERFAQCPNVHCLFGDTTDVLPGLLAQLNRSALLWLDGHWSMSDTAHGAKETPIVEELETVLQDYHRHIILVDDSRCFSGEPHDCEQVHEDFPTLKWVRDRALEHGYVYELSDDVVRLVHASERYPEYADERWQLVHDLVGDDLKGIIHVGAGLGEEAAGYARFRVPVTWVEGNPKLLQGLAWVEHDFGQRVVGAMCSDEEGAAVFHEAQDYRCSSLVPLAKEPADPVEVRTVTLDSLARLLNPHVHRGNLLVVDVQGAEVLVLAGAQQTLERADFVIVEVPDLAYYPKADPNIDQHLGDFVIVGEVAGDRLYERR
jgi:FkbM family methyltransferase